MLSPCKTDLSLSPQSLGSYFAVQVHGQVNKQMMNDMGLRGLEALMEEVKPKFSRG